MSLSAWEQQALDSIKDGLASADPTLVARLTILTRLASGEEMPARERGSMPTRSELPDVLPDRYLPARCTSAGSGSRQRRRCCGW